jgi:hypothetical protein
MLGANHFLGAIMKTLPKTVLRGFQKKIMKKKL